MIEAEKQEQERRLKRQQEWEKELKVQQQREQSLKQSLLGLRR